MVSPPLTALRSAPFIIIASSRKTATARSTSATKPSDDRTAGARRSDVHNRRGRPKRPCTRRSTRSATTRTTTSSTAPPTATKARAATCPPRREKTSEPVMKTSPRTSSSPASRPAPPTTTGRSTQMPRHHRRPRIHVHPSRNTVRTGGRSRVGDGHPAGQARRAGRSAHARRRRRPRRGKRQRDHLCVGRVDRRRTRRQPHPRRQQILVTRTPTAGAPKTSRPRANRPEGSRRALPPDTSSSRPICHRAGRTAGLDLAVGTAAGGRSQAAHDVPSRRRDGHVPAARHRSEHAPRARSSADASPDVTPGLQPRPAPTSEVVERGAPASHGLYEWSNGAGVRGRLADGAAGEPPWSSGTGTWPRGRSLSNHGLARHPDGARGRPEREARLICSMRDTVTGETLSSTRPRAQKNRPSASAQFQTANVEGRRRSSPHKQQLTPESTAERGTSRQARTCTSARLSQQPASSPAPLGRPDGR